MVKRRTKLKPMPPLPAPSPGDLVWYEDKDWKIHVGTFIRVVERGKKFGMCEIEDATTKKTRFVLPENMEKVRKQNGGG